MMYVVSEMSYQYVRVHSVDCHTSQSSSNSIEKRFYSLFFSNFAKVCIQVFGIESLVLIYYIFYGNVYFIKFKYFQGV